MAEDRFETNQVLRNQPSKGEIHEFSSNQSTLTPYMRMSLLANEVSVKHSLLAALYSWLTLSGYIVIPGALHSLKNSQALNDSRVGELVQDTVQKVSLMVLAGVLCLVGTIGTYWLWRLHKLNYLWLRRQIFLPGLMHSIAGVLTIIINVTTAYDENWPLAAKISTTVIGIFIGSWSVLCLVYTFLIEKIKQVEDGELAKSGQLTNS